MKSLSIHITEALTDKIVDLSKLTKISHIDNEPMYSIVLRIKNGEITQYLMKTSSTFCTPIWKDKWSENALEHLDSSECLKNDYYSSSDSWKYLPNPINYAKVLLQIRDKITKELIRTEKLTPSFHIDVEGTYGTSRNSFNARFTLNDYVFCYSISYDFKTSSVWNQWHAESLHSPSGTGHLSGNRANRLTLTKEQANSITQKIKAILKTFQK